MKRNKSNPENARSNQYTPLAQTDLILGDSLKHDDDKLNLKKEHNQNLRQILAIAIMILTILVVGFEIINSFIPYPEYPLTIPQLPTPPYDSQCSAVFKPFIYKNLPVYTEKEKAELIKYYQKMQKQQSLVTFGGEFAGFRYDETQSSCQEVLAQYELKVAENKVPFRNYQYLVCGFLREPYDGDRRMTLIRERKTIFSERIKLYKSKQNLKRMEFNLHLGAHSHMDLGWLRTYFGYSNCKLLQILTLLSN